MYQLKNEYEVIRFQREADLLLVRYENRMRKAMSPAINRQYIDAAKYVESGDRQGIDQAVNDQGKRITGIFQKYYRSMISAVAVMMFRRIEAIERSTLPAEAKDMRETYWRTMENWLRTMAATQVTKVQKTTKKLLRHILQKAAESGDTYRDIAKKIRATGKIASKTRSLMIATTEMHTALNKSTDETMRSTRIPMEKQWMDAGDERVRADHRNVDGGDWIPMDQDFLVGTHRMSYPGDPKGGANNTVRCRCTAQYRRKQNGA